MFALLCPHCATRRLMFAGQVRSLGHDDRGVSVVLECWCGGLLSWHAADAGDTGVPVALLDVEQVVEHEVGRGVGREVGQERELSRAG